MPCCERAGGGWGCLRQRTPDAGNEKALQCKLAMDAVGMRCPATRVNLGSRIWGQTMGTKLAESERGVWFSWERYGICTPRFNRKYELVLFRGRETDSAPKLWSPGVCRSAPECGRACWPRLRLRRPPALVRLLAPRLPSSTFRSSRALRVRPTGGQACRRARELRRRWRSAGPVPAPTRGFVLAALTLKPNSLPGQPRVTLSLRKEHVKSSLRAMPGGKEPNIRPKK